MKRMAVLCGSTEDETVVMELMSDASALEVVHADDEEVWRARRPPRQDPSSAEQVARDYLKEISEMCLTEGRTAYVWVQSDRAAVAIFISTLLAAELLSSARPSAFTS